MLLKFMVLMGASGGLAPHGDQLEKINNLIQCTYHATRPQSTSPSVKMNFIPKKANLCELFNAAQNWKQLKNNFKLVSLV